MPTRLFASRSQFARDSKEWNRELSSLVAIDLGAWSRKGSSRLLNEDYFTSASIAIARGRTGAPLFLAVADGLGGEEAGEWASRMATQSMVESLGARSVRRI